MIFITGDTILSGIDIRPKIEASLASIPFTEASINTIDTVRIQLERLMSELKKSVLKDHKIWINMNKGAILIELTLLSKSNLIMNVTINMGTI